MIKNLKADENNWFLEGTFDSDSLFQGEMSVSIFTDDGATVEDAEACIAQYQQLKKNAAFCVWVLASVPQGKLCTHRHHRLG